MRLPTRQFALVLLMVGAACGGPTEADINESLEATLRSVSGPWSGSTQGDNRITLTFSLQQVSNGAITGTGTMSEQGTGAQVPVTITGSFQRPTLSLTIMGMVYEGRTVQGTVTGSYTSAAGVSSTLYLTGTDFARSLPVLLQES